MQYRALDSLAEYLTVAQDAPFVTQRVRQSERSWLLWDIMGLDKTITLASIGCTLRMADIYESVPLAEALPSLSVG